MNADVYVSDIEWDTDGWIELESANKLPRELVVQFIADDGDNDTIGNLKEYTIDQLSSDYGWLVTACRISKIVLTT